MCTIIIGTIAYGQKMVVPLEWFEGIISTQHGSLQLMPIRGTLLIQIKADLHTNVHVTVHWNKIFNQTNPNQKNETKLVLLFKLIAVSAKTIQKNVDDNLSYDEKWAEWAVHGVQKVAVNRFPFKKRRCKRKRKTTWDHSHWIRNELLMMQWWLWCSTLTVIIWKCDRHCECMFFMSRRHRIITAKLSTPHSMPKKIFVLTKASPRIMFSWWLAAC